MSRCHCGEFDRRTIAPDEFGETMIHDLDKCAVPLVKVSDETTIRLLRVRLENAERRIAAALAARDASEAKVQRVQEACRGTNPDWQGVVVDQSSLRVRDQVVASVLRALDGGNA